VQHPKQSLSIFKSVRVKSKRERNNISFLLRAKFHYTLEIYVLIKRKKKKKILTALSMSLSIIDVILNRAAFVRGIRENIESRA